MKQCIFDDNKPCTNCGDCDVCIFDKNKICSNCGKCLELEGYDVKAIKIDEVFENNNKNAKSISLDLENFSDFDLLEDEDFEEDLEKSLELENDDMPYIDVMDNEENWTYLDDVEGINELIEDNDGTNELIEKFPGLYVYKKH